MNIRWVTTYSGHPFSRSYGAKLPSSLTGDNPRTLVFSTRLPVSVYGTVTPTSTPARLFLGSVVRALPPAQGRVPYSPSGSGSGFASTHHSPTGLEGQPPVPGPFPSASPPRLRRSGGGILTPFPSPTPFGLRLGAG